MNKLGCRLGQLVPWLWILWQVVGLGVAFKVDLNLSTKTPYWQQQPNPNLDIPSTCVLKQLNYVIRHGTRNPSAKDIQKMQKLVNKLHQASRESRVKIPAWLEGFEVPYEMHLNNLLVSRGVQEMISLGQRLRQAYGPTLPKSYNMNEFIFEHTWKDRTAQSASAFAYGFFNGHQPVNFEARDKNEDVALRFFDKCDKYTNGIETNETAFEQYSKYLRSTHMRTNLRKMRQKLAVLHGSKDEEVIEVSDLLTLYNACSFDVAVHGTTLRWCNFFSADMMESLEFYKDLKVFWVKGYGHAMDWQVATPLLRNIYDSMTQFISGDLNVKGHFRFAHAETLLPLICLLKQQDDQLSPPLLASYTMDEIRRRKFRASHLAPFGGNVGFHLYECQGKEPNEQRTHKILVLINEQPIHLTGCDGAMLCDMKLFERFYAHFLFTWNFETECAS